MELHDALAHIAEIRHRVAGAQQFRGYRAGPVAATGLVAFAAAALQPLLIPTPAADLAGYLTLWTAASALGVLLPGLPIAVRDYLAGPTATRQLTREAVLQFAPCLLAGALLTAAVSRHVSSAAPLLPGLWQVLFGLGVLAGARLLPKPIAFVGAWYLGCGAVCVALGSAEFAFSPVLMAVPFGVGQLVTAAVLYWHYEREADRAPA